VFAITRDVFIVYTSNIFAVLGLRALAFMVSSLVRKLRYLKVGLSLVLAFVGVKMLIAPRIHIPEVMSLAVVVTLLLGSALASLVFAAPPDGVVKGDALNDDALNDDALNDDAPGDDGGKDQTSPDPAKIGTP
jgi:tellurite resistance protein TerC